MDIPGENFKSHYEHQQGRIGKAAVKTIGKATEGEIVIAIVKATEGTIHNLICKG